LGISKSTRNAYRTGLHNFCAEINQWPVPVTEDSLLFFATYLAQQHLSYAIIQVYLSAVKHNQTTAGKSLPSLTPRLNYVLKGIQRSATIINQPRDRLLITFPIMARLHATFSKHPNSNKDVMIWAACCLAYFGLLIVSEFTTLSPNHFDPAMDLLLSDVALDKHLDYIKTV